MNNKAVEKWNSDLKSGEFGELCIANFLKERGYKILKNNKTMDYDLMIEKDGFIKTLEIKTDRWERFNWTTNNIFLEVSCNGKKSGIMGSKADYFIYFFPDHELFYLIRMDEVRKLVNFGRRKSFSGDGGRVLGWTINRFEFAEHFKINKIKKDKRWDLFDK